MFSYAVTVDKTTADRLRTGAPGEWYTVEIRPPADDGDVPATLPRFIREVMELQSRWKLWNASPVSVFEIRRPAPDTLRLQFAVPTKRLERKVRTHLSEEVPAVKFDTGASGLPISEGDSVGGGILKLGRPDMFPLRSEFDRPPTNNIIAALHRHAIRDTRVIIQILFQPVAGRPIRNWWWKRRAYKRVGYLRKEKHYTFHDRNATPAEKRQADAVEEKARTPRFHTAIRILLIGVDDDFVRSRVKELAGAFNVYESLTTNQYLDTYTVKSLFPSRITKFAASVARRSFDGWTLPFQAGLPELAGLVAVPALDQTNLRHAHP